MKMPRMMLNLGNTGRQGYLEPPADICDLTVQWIAPRQAARYLRQVRTAWYRQDLADLLEPLTLIQWEVNGAQALYHPFPDIAVAITNHHVVGVLCGYMNELHRCFFISEIAFHPSYALYREIQTDVGRSLVEAAIDFSQELGFHGWVGCADDMHHLQLLRQLGFSQHDDFTYRKMGYFS